MAPAMQEWMSRRAGNDASGERRSIELVLGVQNERGVMARTHSGEGSCRAADGGNGRRSNRRRVHLDTPAAVTVVVPVREHGAETGDQPIAMSRAPGEL